MNHLETLSDDELHRSTVTAARQDQASTLNTIDHLREVYRRMLHLKRGFSSLQNYAEEALGFSDSAAAERVSAVRLTVAVPEVRAKLELRELTVSSAVAVERFIRREEQVAERRFSLEEKKLMVEEVAGCSVRETRKALLSFAKDPEPHLLRERERPVTPTRTELTLFVNDGFLGELARVKELKGLQSLEEIFAAALAAYLGQIDPVRRMAKAKERSAIRTVVKKVTTAAGVNDDGSGQSIRTSESEPGGDSRMAIEPVAGPVRRTESRYTRVDDARRLEIRSGGQCEFVDEETGRRCPGRFRIQKDHCLPFALGGPTEFWNLRHYCRAHNQMAAVQVFGTKKMRPFLDGGRNSRPGSHGAADATVPRMK